LRAAAVALDVDQVRGAVAGLPVVEPGRGRGMVHGAAPPRARDERRRGARAATGRGGALQRRRPVGDARGVAVGGGAPGLSGPAPPPRNFPDGRRSERSGMIPRLGSSVATLAGGRLCMLRKLVPVCSLLAGLACASLATAQTVVPWPAAGAPLCTAPGD